MKVYIETLSLFTHLSKYWNWNSKELWESILFILLLNITNVCIFIIQYKGIFLITACNVISSRKNIWVNEYLYLNKYIDPDWIELWSESIFRYNKIIFLQFSVHHDFHSCKYFRTDVIYPVIASELYIIINVLLGLILTLLLSKNWKICNQILRVLFFQNEKSVYCYNSKLDVPFNSIHLQFFIKINPIRVVF